MTIVFRTRALKNLAHDAKAARKELGETCARRLRSRLDDLQAAGTLEAMRNLPGRCHQLKGDRSAQFGIDLEHPRRLVFEPIDGESSSTGGLDWNTVTAIEIVEIVDYH